MPNKPGRSCCCFHMAMACKIVPGVQVVKALVALGLNVFYSLNEGLSFLTIHHAIISVLFVLCAFFSIKILFLFRRKMVNWKSFEIFYKSIVFCSFLWILELAALITAYVYYDKNPFELMTLTMISSYCIMQDLYFSFCIYSSKANSEIGNMFSIFEGRHPSEIIDDNLPRTSRTSVEALQKKKVQKNTYTIIVQDFTQSVDGQFISSEVLKV